MKKVIPIVIIVLALFFIFSPKGSSKSETKTSRSTTSTQNTVQWFQKGTLNSASTVGDWRKASSDSKLATAGDWLAATDWKGHLNSMSDFDKLKVKAQLLSNALDEAVRGSEELDSMILNEVAAAILTLANDLGPN